MDSGRAGWYSCDRIDNRGKPGARTIVADLQCLSVGDFIPMIEGMDAGCWVKDMIRKQLRGINRFYYRGIPHECQTGLLESN